VLLTEQASVVELWHRPSWDTLALVAGSGPGSETGCSRGAAVANRRFDGALGNDGPTTVVTTTLGRGEGLACRGFCGTFATTSVTPAARPGPAPRRSTATMVRRSLRY
jgi:hypothetical protein